jgi:NADPH-dependent ferric siderophore reductase
MTKDSSANRVQRVRHETKRRELEVVRVATITPSFRSVTFAGPALAGFTSASFDDHVKLILESEEGDPVMRDYTPRHYDDVKGELTIEFCLHGDGPAANWASQAAPGQRAVIGGPRGSFIIPLDYDWYLLAGDETALPAIARRLAELPAGTSATVIVHVNDARDQREFKTDAAVRVEWVASMESLVDRVRGLSFPTGDTHAWCAGEARAMAALRRILVEEKGLDRHAVRAAAYWKQGAAAHHENLQES